jgi:hypothetical protein
MLVSERAFPREAPHAQQAGERLVFYFLTHDLRNKKERNEIEYLSRVGRVVLVSCSGKRESIAGARHLSLGSLTPRVARLYLAWTRIAYLVARIARSSTDLEFPARNIYAGNRLVRTIVNRFWKFKRLSWVNRWLPTYDQVYFAPFRLAALFGRKPRGRSGRYRRVLVHDALLLRLEGFAAFIARARRGGVQTVANIKSWDNPFYSQFARSADAFLVWSRGMWADVQSTHELADRPVHVWGARPFFNFSHALSSSQFRAQARGPGITIGYAAAFCDGHMVAHEVAVVRRIALELQQRLPQAKLLVRPYPILPLSAYGSLAVLPNVEILDIKGELTDRFGDGREFIRFGSDEERLDYLSRCDCFLSLATSFTIEAAMCGLPVVHFFMRPEKCASREEFAVFQRIAISDHLDVYFNRELLSAHGYEELSRVLEATCSGPSIARQRAATSIRKIGIPEEFAGWHRLAATLASDIRPRRGD